MFNPTRLVVARQRRGLTKRQLSEQLGIEARSITGFEAGEYEPRPETATKISRVLNFPLEFFEADDIDIPSSEGVSFRSMSKMTSRQRDAAIAAGAIAYLLIDWVEARFDLPPLDLPDLREDAPEIAAISLRQYWGLGELPVKNMVHLLEAKGVRVFSLQENCREVDAYSVWRGMRPCVFLNTEKSPERSRYDAAHELGHLILHRHAAPHGIDAEKEANKFAGAFLMPEASMKSFGRITNLNELIELKRKWKVSVSAATYRSFEVGLISKWHYQTLFKEISMRGWRTKEPFGIRPETSIVWYKVLSQLRQQGVGLEALAQEIRVPTEELVKLVFGLVTIGMPSNKGDPKGTSRKPHLRVIK